MQAEFGIDFQKHLIKYLLTDIKFYMLARKYLRADFFTNKFLVKIYTYTQKHYDKYNELPTKTILMTQFSTSLLIKDFVEEMFDGVPVEREFIKDKLEEFFKRNMFVRYYSKSGQLYNDDKIQECFDLMSDGYNKIEQVSLDTDGLEFLFQGFVNRTVQRDASRGSINELAIPTGIKKLDWVLQGGLRNGEVGLIIGDAKSGKSTALRYFGLSAVRRYNCVLHIQLEDTKQKVLDAYDATMMGVSYHQVRNGDVSEEIILKTIKNAQKRTKKDLIIKAYPEWDACTVQDIDNIWYQLYLKGFYCGLVIVDYLDLLKSRRIYDEERHRQTSVARDLKSFANKRNVAVWTATQTFREVDVNNPDFVITEKSVAEDYNKIRIVDIPVSINMTAKEAEANLARLYVCRSRTVKGGKLIRIEQDLQRSLFYTKSLSVEEVIEESKKAVK